MKEAPKHKNILSSTIIAIVEVAVLLTVASYAWFSDKSNPSITQSNIKVSAAEGLVIKLTPDSAARTTINLEEIFSNFDLFELKQMSSADGRTFYTIDFGAGLANNRPQYVLLNPEEDGLLNMEEYGCIDYDFYLQTENYAKHVYLHQDTSLTGTASDAIRTAITVDDPNYNILYIFGDTPEKGTVAAPYTTRAVIAPGQFDYFSTSSSNLLTDNQTVYTFDEKNGGRGMSDDASIDLSKILMTIPANTTVKINVKIWLEGGDLNCTNILAASTIDATIKFGSANVLRDAPNVYANNSTITITNLATTMEYNLTSPYATTWTTVTNPSMTFARGNTVYVRYKAVQNVSSESYVTTVLFN